MPGPLTASQIGRAGELLAGALGDKTQIALDDAVDRLSLADRHEKALDGRISRDLVALLLRRRGFRPAGWYCAGEGRVMLYVRPAA